MKNREMRYLVMMLVCLMIMIPAGAWAEEGKNSARKDYAERDLLVRFHAWAGEKDKKDARALVEAELIREMPALGLEYWRLPEGMAPLTALEIVAGLPAVVHAEPNFLYAPQTVPDDRDFSRLWYLENTGQRVNSRRGRPGADISATGAWDVETGSRELVIAVIDSGVAVDHPDLKNNIWRNRQEIADNGIDDDDNGYVDDVWGWDFVNDDNNPSDYSKDLYGDGHGTHVAGIIAAEGNNGIGATGVMWEARIMPVQIFDLFENSPFNATTLVVLEALLYAVENGAKIINCSFGGPSFSRFLFEAYQQAGNSGVLVVAAAGNDSRSNDFFPVYPANYALDNIVSVAATDENDALAAYSNYGEGTVDVAAPGGSGTVSNIYNTTPPERKVMFADDFESAENKWLTSGENESWSIVYNQIFNSTVVVDSINNYQENEFSYIRTAAPVSAANFRGLNLRFSILYALERQYDFLSIELSQGNDGEYETINTITGFSAGIERLVIWSNDAAFDDFYLRFSLSSDENTNFDGVYLDDISLTGIEWVFSGDEYGFKSGTSMATPVVAGVAGLVWSVRPDLTYAQVKEILMNATDPVASLDGKVISGGRINARSAVLLAAGETPVRPPADSESDASDSGSDSGCFIATFLTPNQLLPPGSRRPPAIFDRERLLR